MNIFIFFVCYKDVNFIIKNTIISLIDIDFSHLRDFKAKKLYIILYHY